MLIAVGVALVCLQVYLDLEIPGYMSSITTTISLGGSVDAVMRDGWGMVACAVGSLVTSIAVGFIAAYIAASLARRLRRLEFERVESFSMEEINDFSTASLITRSTNDITQVQMAVAMGLQVMVKAPIMAVYAVTKILGKSWEWTATTAVAVVVIMVVLSVIMYVALPRFKRIQWITDDLNRETRENITGIRVIRAFNAESHQQEGFDRSNDKLTDNNLFINRTMAVIPAMMSTLMSGLSLAIYWIGAILISNTAGPMDRLTLFSDMVVFSSYAIQVVMSFMMVIVIMIILPRAMVAAQRIEEVIDTGTSINDGPVTSSPEGVSGEIVFENVGFRYPNGSDYVIRDVDLTIHRGETVAIIGSTGSGKSTLVNLIPRFHDVTEGSIRVDGIDVRDYTLDALHAKIGYVPQRSVLFSGSVSYNVGYGREGATEDEVRRAVSIAQGTDFVEAMDGGYDATIAQGGRNVSGGQKQRLSIARAVCRDPEIYIFDDSFSALDYRTDRAVREALRRETGGATRIIVAQRVGTIMDADTIVVLDEGRVVGMGRHRDLLRSCDVYREIASSQLTGEELGI